jgi:hypothetical protein
MIHVIFTISTTFDTLKSSYEDIELDDLNNKLVEKLKLDLPPKYEEVKDKVVINKEQTNNDKLRNWLKENLVYSKDSYVTLSGIITEYSPNIKLNSRQKGSIRSEIERYISDTYYDKIDNKQFVKVKINKKTCVTLKHFSLIDNINI